MKVGETKNFVFIGNLGLIEAGNTMKETIERINREEVNKEIADKKMLKMLKKQHPGCEITKFGSIWLIGPQ